MTQDVRDGVIRAVEASYRPTKYEQDTVECPACGRLALVEGATEGAATACKAEKVEGLNQATC